MFRFVGMSSKGFNQLVYVVADYLVHLNQFRVNIIDMGGVGLQLK